MENELIRIFDANFRYVGVCDDYSYLSYRDCFSEAGELVMRVVFTPQTYVLYATCAYLCCPGGQCFAVDAISSDGAEITVKGRDVLILFDRAVLPEAQVLTGTATEILCTLAAMGQEVLPLTITASAEQQEETGTFDATPGSLYTALRAACAAFGVGMALRYVPGQRTLDFVARTVRDRTSSQREREPLILGRERENLAEEYYTCDRSDYRNAAIVSGRNKKDETVTVTVPPPEGQSPRYLYYAANGLKASLYATDDLFRAALARTGERLLTSYQPQLTYVAVLNPNGTQRVEPGDRADVRALGGAEALRAVVASVETVYDRGHRERKMVAGTVIPTLPEILDRVIL